MVRFNKTTFIGKDDPNEINYQKMEHKDFFFFFNNEHKLYKYIHNKRIQREKQY